MDTLRFIKIRNNILPSIKTTTDGTLARSMVTLENVNGYAAIFKPGSTPTFILKSSKGSPRLFKLAAEGVRSLSTFHTADTNRGFLYVDLKVSLL